MSALSLARAGAVIAAGTLASRLLGLLRAIVLVYAISSVGFAAESFATAGRIPNTVYTLIATGALTAVIVPQITKAALSADGGQKYVNKLITLTLLGSGAILVLAALFTPALIRWLTVGWSDEQIQLAVVFAFWLLPQIVFYALFTVLGEVLNARSVFGPAAWSPVLNNVLNIIGLLAFVVIFGADPNGVRVGEVWTPAAIALLAGSATLGVALQALVLFGFWRRANLRFRLDFQFRGIGLGHTGRVASWTFLTVLATQLVGLVNTRVLNLAGTAEAGLAATELAGLIFVLPHAIITVSLVTARFTKMSESVHAGDSERLASHVRIVTRQTAFAMSFFTAAMLVLALPLIRIVQPGASYSILAIVAPVLVANLIGLLPFSLLFVFNRAFYAHSDTRTPFLIAVGQSILTIGVAWYVSTLPTNQIAVVLTLWVSILIAVQAVVTFALFRRGFKFAAGREMIVSFVQVIIAAMLSGAAGFGVLALLGGTNESSFAVSSFLGALVSSAVVAIVMGMLYAGVLLLVRNAEAQELLRRLSRRPQDPPAALRQENQK